RTPSDPTGHAGAGYNGLVRAARVDVEGQCSGEDAFYEWRARIAIDGRQLVEAHALLDVVNARRPVSRPRVRLFDPLERELVIGLTPPCQHIGVVDPGTEQGVLLDRAATVRADENGECRRMDPDLLEPVTVEIELLDLQGGAAPQLAFRQREIAPDGLAQVWEVQPSEHAVPVRVVALRAADRLARRRRVAAAPAQGGQALHLLVHPVRLGIAHEEIAPVRPPDQRRVGARQPFGPEIALEPREPGGGLRRKRPALHLAV